MAAGEATVNELAEPFDISLQAVSKHLKVLERAGLITRGRDAQWRPCRLEVAPLETASEWIERYREIARDQFDRLEQEIRKSNTSRKGRTMSETEIIVEPGRQDIVMTRVFDAPRDVVFKAMTDPDLIPNWWGPRRYTTEVDRMEVRPGGLWRFLNRDEDGNEYAFKGVYHDIVSPERIVQTFEFEGMPGHVQLETATLEEVDGKTRYMAVSVFQSLEDRDAMVQSGVEEGVRETIERLAEVVQDLLGRSATRQEDSTRMG